MPFIKFTESGRSFTPKVTISNYGSISFNEGACTRFNIKGSEAIVFYFDPDTRRIGMELTDDKTAEGARPIRKREMGADVPAKPFLDRWDIRPTQTTSYPLELDDEAGYLIINLTKGVKRGKKAENKDE